MNSLFDRPPIPDSPEELQRRIDKLQKINTALMQRVERSMDAQANAYSLFQTAITLEGQVRMRTEEVTNALSRLERT
ncbi:MAG: hybrid sensor histidine kinase/response regulator, partial [Hyphomicrobium sp.]